MSLKIPVLIMTLSNLHPDSSETLQGYNQKIPTNSMLLPLIAAVLAARSQASPCSHGSHAPYANTTTIGESHEPAPPASSTNPAHTSAHLKPAHWNELWSLHWPEPSPWCSSAISNPSLLGETPTFATTRSKACPDRPSKLSTLTVPMVAGTTITQATSSTAHRGPIQPIIFDPGLLSVSATQTKTVHITLTTSAPDQPPTESSLRGTTMTSTTMSTLTRTITSSTRAPPSSTIVSSSIMAIPSSMAIPKTSEMQQVSPSVRTSVISADPRCPYPFPGVYCGEAKTTIITDTQRKEASTTSAPVAVDGDKGTVDAGWCPYPGSQCWIAC